MRVVHVAAGSLFGGIERMLVTIARAAAPPRTHEVAVAFDGRLVTELQASGVLPHVLGAARFSRPDTIWRTRRALRRVLTSSHTDAVVAHAPWGYAVTAPVARRLRIPVVMWVHDPPHREQFLERRVAARPPHGFICNSAYTAELVERWMPAVPRRVVHPPVELPPPASAAARAEIRRREGAADGQTVILLAARLEPWKGHRVLIEAAARLQGDVVVWIAGGPQRPHEAERLADLTSLTGALVPAGRVRFLGQRDDVASLMAAADIYCQPNTGPEPFGIAFAEALAAGIPVVTTACGGAIDIVDERCGILTSEPSPAQVAAALQRLIDDPALRASLGAAGPARAAAVCDPAARLREIDDAVAAGRLRSSAA